MNRWSVNKSWSRRQWVAVHWVLAVGAAVDVVGAVLLGPDWLGLAVVLCAVAGVAAAFCGERIDHGPRPPGGDPQ